MGDQMSARHSGVMAGDEIAAAVIGKTIAEIVHGTYLCWGMTVDSIRFTDGSVLELAGNADEARVVEYIDEDGRMFGVADAPGGRTE